MDTPWKNEPDRVEFEAHGLPCLIRRAQNIGSLCGYAAVPPGHPLHGKALDDDEVGALDCHGGITYANGCAGEICHKPKPGEPDNVWWLGFDCAHAHDLTPSMFEDYGIGGPGCRYRDIDYVRAQTENLAAQLAALAKP